MCGSSPQPAAPVTPAAAPAPPAPPPTETAIGQGRQNENIAQYGTVNGPSTRVDRSVNGGATGGSGLNV